MGNINELLFQILLAVAGVLIGLIPAVYPNENRRLKLLLGIVSYAAVAIAFFWIGYRYSQQRPYYRVANQLAQPIHVYANGGYEGTVQPGKTGVFSRYSFDDFPLTVHWEIKKYESFGNEMGETIKKVDNGQTIVVDNQVGNKTYFHPVITSMINSDCRISINDGTSDQEKGGIIPANAKNVTPGYFVLRPDSNVTLYCDGMPHWLGKRGGTEAGTFSKDVELVTGNLPLFFYKPDP